MIPVLGKWRGAGLRLVSQPTLCGRLQAKRDPVSTTRNNAQLLKNNTHMCTHPHTDTNTHTHNNVCRCHCEKSLVLAVVLRGGCG